MSKRRRRRLSASEVAAFCEQISLLLDGGIPLHEGIHILYQEMEEKERKGILRQVDTLVKESHSFSEALEQGKAFPEYMVHMVKIGETTGKLEEVMMSLARYYEREHKVKQSIRNVIFYPIMLFAMLGIILLVLVIKILPMFQNVFYELDSQVSRTSEHMMEVSMWIGKGVSVVVLFLFTVVIVGLLINKTRVGNEQLNKLAMKLPYSKRIMYELNIGKFVSAMSLMINSGLSGEESLRLAETIVEHELVKKRVAHCIRSIKNHGTFEDSLRDSRLITGMNGRMVSIGVKTGVLDMVFERLTVRYDEQIDLRLGSISTMVETIIVLALSAIVGLVLISVMLPLVSIISSIG